MSGLLIDAKWALLTSGGVSRLSRHLVRGSLQRWGKEQVEVVGPTGNGGAVSAGAEAHPGAFVELPWARTRLRWAHLLYDQISLARHIHRRAPRLFVSPHVEHPVLSNVPLVAFIYDLSALTREPGQSRFNHRYYATLLERSLKKARLTVTISALTDRELRRRGASRTCVVEASVGALDPGPADATEREEFFLYTGGAHARKRVDVLIAAWRTARLRGMIGELWITGRPESYASLVPNLNEGEEGLRFLGVCDERILASLYRRCRAAVYLSSAEGYGLPVDEALLAGTPVLCSDLELLRYEHGEAPVYVTNDVEAVAERMIALSGDDRLHQDLARRARHAGDLLRTLRLSTPGWNRLFELLDEDLR